MTKHRQGAASVIGGHLRRWVESGALENKKTGFLFLLSRNIIIGRQGGTWRSGSGPCRVNKAGEREKEEQIRQKASQKEQERVVPAEVSCPRLLVAHTTETDRSTCCLRCSMQITKWTTERDGEETGGERERWKQREAYRYCACDLSALAVLKPHYQT